VLVDAQEPLFLARKASILEVLLILLLKSFVSSGTDLIFFILAVLVFFIYVV
jgi:hypothetical protein